MTGEWVPLKRGQTYEFRSGPDGTTVRPVQDPVIVSPRVWRSEQGTVAVEMVDATAGPLDTFQLVRLGVDAQAFLTGMRMPVVAGAVLAAERLQLATEFRWVELVDPATMPTVQYVRLKEPWDYD